MESIALLQLHHQSNSQSNSPQSADCNFETPRDGYLCHRCAARDASVHVIMPCYCYPTQEEQEDQVLSASSPLQSPWGKDAFTTAPSVVMDPYVSSSDETLLDTSFYMWLLSQVEPLPYDPLSSFQFEGVPPVSTEDCRREDSADCRQCSEHQEAVSTSAPTPTQLQIEASSLISEDFDALVSAEGFATGPLQYALMEDGPDSASASVTASKQC